jgi:hypothetical protein
MTHICRACVSVCDAGKGGGDPHVMKQELEDIVNDAPCMKNELGETDYRICSNSSISWAIQALKQLYLWTSVFLKRLGDISRTCRLAAGPPKIRICIGIIAC